MSEYAGGISFADTNNLTAGDNSLNTTEINSNINTRNISMGSVKNFSCGGVSYTAQAEDT
jgi:hypothetical protein